MFAFGFFFFHELFIVGTETEDVKPELTVRTEKDDMPSTSHHEGSNEGRYLKMSPKQEDVTRGQCFTKPTLNSLNALAIISSIITIHCRNRDYRCKTRIKCENRER